uniref:F-box domain-containing protein n=1 Tax=Hordeum vulgare subsp. vulgare TaxID=112509 RepID=M0XDF0_HORVV
MAPPPPPPPSVNLIDDVVAEILLRLPPDEPEHLFRAALVCKPWLRVICDPAFRRRYRAFHGAPPLLGLLHRTQVFDGDPDPRFASTTSMPDFPHPGSDGRHTRPLDCRHGRVLIHMFHDQGMDLLVWDPVTGDRHVMPVPDIDWMIYTASVFCATAGCDHLDCHGGPFRVVFLATDGDQDVVKASVYSSVTGAWSEPVSLDDSCECYARHKRDATAKRMYYIPYVQPRRVAAIGDAVYFTISRSSAIAKYDCGQNRLSVIDPPPPDT